MSLTKVSNSLQSSSQVSVLDFGAKGDGVADDTVAIQAAIDSISQTSSGSPSRGGGTVYFPGGVYRITSGLLLGWGTRLLGESGTGYPYPSTLVSGQHNPSVIKADFGANVNQWVIDSATYYISGGSSGQRIAYNDYLPDQIDTLYNSNHKVSIQNIDITSADVTTNIIWGGIRLVGCPNAAINQVSLSGTGIGIEMQTCYLSSVTEFQLNPFYYGLIFHNANNNCIISGTADRYSALTTPTIPSNRIPSILPNSAGCTAYGLDTAHATSDKGFVISNTYPSIGSNVMEVNFTGQYWTDVAFIFGSASTLFKALYTEGSSVRYVLTTAYASVSIENTSAFCTDASAYYFDAGFDSKIDARIDGLASLGGGLFKSVNQDVSADNNTHIVLRGQYQDSVGFDRVDREGRSKALAFASFDGSSLSINNEYNIQSVVRTSGEPTGDYTISFNPNFKGGPYNITELCIPQVTLADNSAVFATVWWGGGDGVTVGTVRVRCFDLSGNVVDPDRVFLTLNM